MGMVRVMSVMVKAEAHPEINGTAALGAVSNRAAPFLCVARISEWGLICRTSEWNAKEIEHGARNGE